MIDKNEIFRKWELVRRFLDFPRLNPPIILTEEEAISRGLADEIAAISIATNEIFVNGKNLEERVGKEHLPRILAHEALHYKEFPFNLRNYIRLIGYADLVTRNLRHAEIIENLYADLYVNTRAYRKGDHGMVKLYRRLSANNDSELWQLYMATYENMIGCQGMIIPQPKEEIRIKSKKLSDIVNSSIGRASRWPSSIKEFAKVVQEYLKKEEQQIKQEKKQGKGGGSYSTNQTASSISKGLIDRHKAKDFIPYDPKKTPKDIIKKEIKKQVKGLAEELGPKEFKRVVAGTGLGSYFQANVWLYEELASAYTLFFPQVPNRKSGDIKESPKRWTLGDPLSKLDYWYSYQVCPIIVPNVTTYQWEYKCGESYGNGEDKPDLLIVLDSSFSMPNPRTDLSFPVLTAMIAAHSALAYGSNVAVINFSTGYESCDFTNQTKEIDEKLVKYLGGGTDIPGDEMVRITSNRVYPIHTMIISDTDIHNLNNEIDNLERTLENSIAGGSVFLCCQPSAKTKKLEEIGYKVQFARDFDDLGNMTLEKAKELYEVA